MVESDIVWSYHIQKRKREEKVKEVKVLIDLGKGEILRMSNDDEKIKAAMYQQLVDGGHEFEEDLYEQKNWGEFDFEIYTYAPTGEDDVEDKSRSDVVYEKLQEKNVNIELTMEVLKRAMIGSKPRDIIQNYLFKAFSLLQDCGNTKDEFEIIETEINRLNKEKRSGKTAMELVYERMDEVDSRFIIISGDKLKMKRGCDYLRLERICAEEGTSLVGFLEFYNVEI